MEKEVIELTNSECRDVWRCVKSKVDDLLDHLGIENKDCLLNKAFGLSLSDHYWMNPAEMIMD